MPHTSSRARWRWSWFNDPAGFGHNDGVAEWPAAEVARARRSLNLKEEAYPVFLGPDCVPDPRLLDWVTSPKPGLASAAYQTKETYAKDIHVWLNFLLVACNGRDWWDATRDDVLNFDYWRRREAQNAGRVRGDTNSHSAAALARLYDWASSPEVGLVTVNPIRRRARSSEERSAPETQSKDDGVKDVKWLTRLAYAQWTRVGLGTHNVKGDRTKTPRVRTRARSMAFFDLQYGTGLRLTEGAGLLAIEVPGLPQPEAGDRILIGELASGLAKYGKRRKFYLRASRMGSLIEYAQHDREVYIHRGNVSGRYQAIRNRLTVVHISGTGWDTLLTIRYPDGEVRQKALNLLKPHERMRLYQEQEGLLRPMALWLAETGEPLGVATWEKVFDAVSERCRRAGLDYYVHPHMLRHSFALHMLVQAQRAFLLPGLSREERLRYQRLFSNPWHLVRDLLGHESVETTRRYYLEPLNGLMVEYVLLADDAKRQVEEHVGLITAEGDREERLGPSVVDDGDETLRVRDVDEVLSRVAEQSDRVMDAHKREGVR